MDLAVLDGVCVVVGILSVVPEVSTKGVEVFPANGVSVDGDGDEFSEGVIVLRTEKVVDLISDVKEGVVGLSVDFVIGVVMVVGVVTFVVEGVVLVVTFVVVVGIVVVVEVVVGVVVVLGVVDDVVITVEVVTSFSQNEPEKFGGH